MANNYFKFKQFTIHQDGSAMKVGTDGVLLGAWANIESSKRILDIGTGTGLIALMMAQRTNCDAVIDAVEIDLESYQQAVDNIKVSPWSSRVNVYHQAFQEFCQSIDGKYDSIVSNPPYFMNGLNAKDDARTKARKADHLPFEDLLKGAHELLNPLGTLSVILPVEEGNYFERMSRLHGFFLKNKVLVLPNPGKEAKRILFELSKASCELQKGELVIENGKRHVYTPEYIELTKDFYLKF